ncbi:MAG: (2E,6E)-farnesyl diphosphate synthase [Gammaproteobacteria bacterium]
MVLAPTLARYQQQIEQALDRALPPATSAPQRLHEAMRYAVLGPGKRIRPILVYATGEALGQSLDLLDDAAVAVELIHAYSLIHDDLPAMDDDDLRRGRPTCHKAFDEATAILAGDAIQALAFEVIVCSTISERPARVIEMARSLAIASGSKGMAGGQAIDLAAVGTNLDLAELENMHLHKTGALIRASVKLGFLASESEDRHVADRLDAYARCIGLAFQVQDDVLDVEGDTEIIGKPQGSDIESNKPTYPNLLGLEGAKQSAKDLCDEAIDNVASLGASAETLVGIAKYIIERDR